LLAFIQRDLGSVHDKNPSSRNAAGKYPSPAVGLRQGSDITLGHGLRMKKGGPAGFRSLRIAFQ